jgi:outer membrane receptor protein involved in Fe transport
MNVIGQEQRTGVLRYVRQRFPRVIRSSQGVEVDLAGSITDNLSMIASYGYTDAKVLEDPGVLLL